VTHAAPQPIARHCFFDERRRTSSGPDTTALDLACSDCVDHSPPHQSEPTHPTSHLDASPRPAADRPKSFHISAEASRWKLFAFRLCRAGSRRRLDCSVSHCLVYHNTTWIVGHCILTVCGPSVRASGRPAGRPVPVLCTSHRLVNGEWSAANAKRKGERACVVRQCVNLFDRIERDRERSCVRRWTHNRVPHMPPPVPNR